MEFDFLTGKDPLTTVVEERVRIEKSPKVEGAYAGVKAALIAAPVGAAIQAIRNKSPGVGALVTGLGAGVLAGLSAAAIQKYKNIQTEAVMRYHMRNILDREPMVMMPEPQALNQAVQYSGQFGQGFQNVYNTY